MKYKGFIVGR